MRFSILSTLAIVPVVLALPTSLGSKDITTRTDDSSTLLERQSCYATCGTYCYSEITIDSAVAQGYGDYRNGSAPGKYPHTFNNYEGFDLLVNGPYKEFPVLHSRKAYTGGPPGPDRVVFNTNGEYAGTVTHTGASGNNFVACT